MNKRQGEYSPDRRRDDIKKHRQSSSNRDYELDDYETNSSDDSEEFDDTVGHIEFRKDDIYNERYLALSELGIGTFGKVFKCLDLKYKDDVAIKIIRQIPKYVESAEIEREILDDIYMEQKRQNKNYCVKLYSSFTLDERLFMVFETLGMSLYILVQKNDFVGMPWNIVKVMTRQILEGLKFLKSMNLVHTDLKLENILLRQDRLLERRHYCHRLGKECSIYIPEFPDIKLIDFGGATYDDEHKTAIINTRQYRGPEVILELGWSFPSDVWSAGCIMAELLDGELLFGVHDNLEHLALMECILESFPFDMVRSCSRRVEEKYFNSRGYVRTSSLSTDSVRHVSSHRHIQDMFDPNLRRVEDIRRLLSKLLRLDPSVRWTAEKALSSGYL